MLKILLIHNEYGAFSGEEAVVEGNCRLLAAHGHEVVRWTRSSADIGQLAFDQTKAFLSGIYNPFTRREARDLLRAHRPDIVHIHNLFPLISPSILGECARAGVPVVMTVHNYRQVCPTGLHLYKGRVCEKCVGGREYWCLLRNCEGDLAKSLGYALRTFTARKFRLYRNNVTLYLCLTQFQRSRLVAAGFHENRMTVLPNSAPAVQLIAEELGDYVGFLGRLSPEKGIVDLMEAARLCPSITFKLAGRVDRMPDVATNRPDNVELLGHLSGPELDDFVRRIRMLVLPSTCFEGFPDVIARAMMYGKPVVCSRIGGLPEIVDDGNTGLLCRPGDSADLADKIRTLWDRPDLCLEMGRAGREKALREYSEEPYYERLIAAYHKALALNASERDTQPA